MSIYQEYKQLNLPHIAAEILKLWHEEAAFEKSIENRNNAKPWVFYEGPPSANGMPGIHHVMARTLKDVFCRYKTMQGYRVERRAGWDTHGLPIELAVEKKLGITKDDIGNTSSKNYIPVEAYNKACRTEVMRFKQQWEDLTQKMGYWVDMTNPYVTYNSKYMESVWWLLAQLYKKNVIYKGYTIQPYSPKAGTGLSSHELNQPGCYKTVKDTSVIAQFKITDASLVHRIFGLTQFLTWDIYALAWTTTPWTLPSNTALTVGADIDYVLVATFNVYTR
ncbi:MAG: class I tRNA ligase family protein, partial [Bacteroidia bacterium]